MKSTDGPPNHWIIRLTRPSVYSVFLEQDHEHQAHGQGVGHIGQKINGLEQVS